ncbi:exopolysaccharide biosynthesis polyprenyl glycosylphosphotransferase [Gluconacetobacter sp. 1b LMG 1731]|uniref:Exopolysaccharide biosynthesis polyprenyl glycosylphosphotransferase n=2 Tax=Gluconacetobacter dulcium TaxID=2729096 RepID=A0A7W4NRE9_9PROT|nr:exopolysaccharide biosynthesis polyprenyl glycosylphosphotransferase [Gluconacetobacter dulcium]MBB2192491.1 exopolysaccharide biosynthesis polyprenyl glycosylphosphotransferase [Gluconacetobacter dulcium]
MADMFDLRAEAAHLAARISASDVHQSPFPSGSNPLARRRSVVIVGGAPDGEMMARRLLQFPEHYEVRGIFDDRVGRLGHLAHVVPFLGNLDDLLIFCRENLPDIIIISIFSLSQERFRSIFEKIRVIPADIYLAVQEHGEDKIDGEVLGKSEFSVFLVEKQPLSGWNFFVKFLEDRVLSFLLLFIFSPLFVMICILVKCDSRGPILFTQTRYGFNSKPIRVLKFRTMRTEQADPSGAKRTVRDDPRVTRVGRYLRRYSFDELPQLLNVLKGEMSIVAPRAHVAAMQVDGGLYEDVVKNYLSRHKIKPGITGLAQVKGCRGEVKTLVDAKRRLCYDLFYINHWSLCLDLKIILMTVYIVLCKNKNTY